MLIIQSDISIFYQSAGGGDREEGSPWLTKNDGDVPKGNVLRINFLKDIITKVFITRRR